MTKTNDTDNATIEGINDDVLRAAHKKLIAVESISGKFDIYVEFLRKKTGSPWRKLLVSSGFTKEQAIAALVALRSYCILECMPVQKGEFIKEPRGDVSK